MTLYSVAQGGVQAAQDVTQFYQLLTGSMTDQVVTVANRISASKTGATAASGYVGGHSGPPTSGTFAAGDMVIDGSAGGTWICTSGGTPGTWQGTGAMLISSQTLGGAASTVTFSSIPGLFRHLMLTYTARSSSAVVTDNVIYRLNGDSGSNYTRGDWSTSNVGASGSVGYNITTTTSGMMPTIYGQSLADSRASGSGVVWLPDYLGTTFVKHTVGFGGNIINAASYGVATRVSGWFSAVAVTSLTLLLSSGGNFVTNSTFNLYGVP